MGRAYLKFAVENSPHYRLMFGDRDWKDGEYPRLAEADEQGYDELVQIIETGQEQGVFRSEPPGDLAFAAWSFVHGMALLMIDGHTEGLGDDEERMTAILNIFPEGILRETE